jgi:hypothetical protein
MPRSFAAALVALAFAPPAFAADPPPSSPSDAPEKLLPSSTQLYVRWDGVAAHSAAYKNSVWGGIMAGPTGDSIRAMLAKGPKYLGSTVLADPLLDGKSPGELKATLGDLKAAEKLVNLIAEKGVIVAAEVREPLPTLKGVGQALGGLVGGGKLPGAEAIMPDAQFIALVPDAGDRAEAIFGSLRLLMRKADAKVEPLDAGGRKGFQVPIPGGGPVQPHVAWWMEGKHFVFYAGTRKPTAVIAEMSTSKEKGGVTAHPLYQRCRKLGDFESVTRGFADTGRVIGLAKGLAGPLVPGLKERLDGTGLSGLKAVVFSSGFEGKESRALYEFDLPDERKGLAKVLKQEPLKLDDLPPMPPDVSRFSALRLDPAAAYGAGLGLVELLALNQDFGVEEDAGKKNPAALIKARKDYLARETDKFLGVSVADDLLPHLGDKVVVFQSPTEGLSAFGTVVCVSVKDAAKLRATLGRIQGAIESIASSPVKVRKKVLKGVEIREFYARGFAAVTPTYAVTDEWLVVAGHPQCVQGVVLRAAGELEKWKPDDATARRLARMPPGCGLQFCQPKSTVGNLCCIGPLFISLFGASRAFQEPAETDFNPFDVGLIPNAHELSKHLFPNLTVTRDDGKTVRIEVNESLSLPLEAVGAEPFAFAILLGLNF